MSEEAPAPPRERRVVGVVLAMIAIGAVAFALVTRMWLTGVGYGDDYAVGLRDSVVCGQGNCAESTNADLVTYINAQLDQGRKFELGGTVEPTGWDPWRVRYAAGKTLDRASGVFAPAGWVTLVAGSLAAFGLVVAVVLALARKRPQLPLSPCTIAVVALGIATIAACVFVATNPDPNRRIGVGVSFWVFAGGVVLGIAGGLLLARATRPDDPDLLDDAMAPEDFE